MGICSSGDQEELRTQTARNRVLSKHLYNDQLADGRNKKLLLLGAGESGKSTVFKQMKTIFGEGFSEEARLEFKPHIYDNVAVCACVLAEESVRFHPPETPAGIAAQAVFNAEFKMGNTKELTPELAQHVRALWADPGIQKTYAMRSNFQLYDCAEYYFNKVEELVAPGYTPSDQDIYRTRVKTTGITEQTYEIEDVKFLLFDVGGQRNERRKWIHCFENVTAVIFVAALSGYDQVLYEDMDVNRVTEALALFDDILNSEWFVNTAMILFLNKKDLFEKKIMVTSLKDSFPDFCGPDRDYDAGVEFLTQKFLACRHSPLQSQERRIYTHVTCATDSDNVCLVFKAVQDIVINRDLALAGLA